MVSDRPDVRLLDPDRELAELQGGPFDGKWISVGQDCVRTELPLFVDGSEYPTMHEYARDDTAIPVLLHSGQKRWFE